MKKTLALLLVASAFACKQEEPPKDYVTFSGQITNPNSDSLIVRSRSYSKTIPVSTDGTFKDTLKLEPGVYSLFDGAESTTLYLKNGYDIKLTMDTNQFDETISYTGVGSENSNFLAKKSLKEEELLDLDKLGQIDNLEALDQSIASIKNELTTFYNSDNTIDSTIVADAVKNVDPMLQSYQRYLASSITLKQELPQGSPSPVFENFENHKGGTTSLSDLKGKYVYVDVWATWCGPCKAEIPHLKRIEEEYQDKNIQFVSISVDDGRGFKGDTPEAAAAAAKEGWKQMVSEKELGGIQLLADKGWKSDFVQNYKINGIPRFILIDPQGNIVTPDAPRPSSSGLVELLKELDI
ncbi:TlpA disulfide reductase family protein [Mangrovimonas sp. YM274]|uniref:TlpA family protein disulfide reductase n=1 Tax=Mangrovimonas sp. YM274 TaxID=3070660 RepID=UPI0027DC7611|nr:TlpA disulfide reductase family protein [Mangrovimonas sp. YM274]WMI67417.1 TlpA disulfide reductase family protein [Mangrovimonas sp. YM274]